MSCGPDKLDPQRGHSSADEYAAALYVVSPHAGQSMNGIRFPLTCVPLLRPTNNKVHKARQAADPRI